MKFLVDECVGPSVARWLQKNGYDAVSIYGELAGIVDDLVLKKAFSEDRVLITSDKDFGEMIFKKKQEHCGVVLLRLLDERPTHKINVLANVLMHHRDDLLGNFVAVTEETIRITRLVSA